MNPDDWLPVTHLAGARLLLEPLRIDHVEEMARLLDDPQLHTFTGGQPAAVEDLRRRYARQVVGRSADRKQRWLNWVARQHDDAEMVGYVQATVTHEERLAVADVAWVIGTAHQGRGYAHEAARLMVEWLRDNGVDTVVAHIHPGHHASGAVARRLGLRPTDHLVDGEVRWQG